MRNTLLIGSMPFENEQAAMTKALDSLGSSLFSLPDGEIGEKSALYPKGNRSAWVLTVINQCASDKANFEVVQEVVRNQDGFPVDYKHLEKLKPKHSPSELHLYLNLGYYDYFKSSYAIFKRLKAERNLPHLKFQVGIPTGLDITFIMMKPLEALRYARAFNRRIAYEVRQIISEAGDDVIFQVEVPGELAMAYMLPGVALNLPVGSVRSLVKLLPSSARLGIHLCLGDLNNEALTRARTLEKMVDFSNKLIETWPQDHPPLYIHYPLAEAAEPPRLEADYYTPLKRIKLPPGTQFIAGIVHEKLGEQENRQILQTLEKLRGGTVGIACSCGLGRRSPETASVLLERMNRLASV
ncbi:MAG TPA: hypothetical protein VH186_31570 [Chloroflexia bacterium]|nr:hypothetical protein [Chloroflexia bacterium]